MSALFLATIEHTEKPLIIGQHFTSEVTWHELFDSDITEGKLNGKETYIHTHLCL